MFEKLARLLVGWHAKMETDMPFDTLARLLAS